MSKSLRILNVITDYPEFLAWLYGQNRGLERQSYREQARVRYDSLFGVADFYSTNLRKLGHEAWDVYANNEFLQRAWGREHGVRFEEPTGRCGRLLSAARDAGSILTRTPLRHVTRLLRPWIASLNQPSGWFYDILAAQIKHYRPDILVNHDMGISRRFLGELKPYLRLLVGQIASPLPPRQDFSGYDLVISSLPNLVDHFRRIGLSSAFSRLAFEPRVLGRLNLDRPKISVSFVGSLSEHHQSRVQMLEYLCARLGVEVWGRQVGRLRKNSSIPQCQRGSAWGIEMYQILCDSKITLNHHIEVADSYANNMRLFEATGVGALLITDWKKNLAEMFEPGREVVVYRSAAECAELIRYYLDHDDEREAIAQAGQKRTCREHTYEQRMQEFVEIVGAHL
jgi:hypothetical protein